MPEKMDITMANILDRSLEDIFKDTKPTMRRGRTPNKNRRRKRGGPQYYSPQPQRRRRRLNGRENANRVIPNNWLYITSESDVKTCAGAIAHAIRRGESPRLLCTGQYAINQAVKSLAVSRDYLSSEGFDFKIYPTLQPDRGRNDSIFLQVISSILQQEQPELTHTGAQILTSSSRAKASKMGGKIAHTIRRGRRVVVRSIGPGAAWRFVQSLMLAKEFVRTDDNLDLSFRTQFVILPQARTNDEADINALQFHVYAEEI